MFAMTPIDYIASCDAGNGGTNICLRKIGQKSAKMYYEPTVRAVALGESLGLEDMEMQYTTVDWYGNRYVTGDDVVRVTRRGLERHLGQDRYGNEFHQFMTAACLAKAGLKSGNVDLTLFCPPGFFTKMKPIIITEFTKSQGGVKIQLSSDKNPRTWQYSNVTVLPEGLGALMSFALDEQGNMVVGDILDGEIVLLDIGVHTLDAAKVINGQFNPEKLDHATWDGLGLDSFIRQPILDLIHKQDPDFTVLTVDDVDLALRTGHATGKYTLSSAGKTVDITPAVKKASDRYADWIANTVLDNTFNGLRGVRQLIIVGGGAFFTTQQLIELYPDKVMNPQDYPHTKKILPSEMNAVGGERLALARLRKQGKI
jgi:hypothetical protein